MLVGLLVEVYRTSTVPKRYPTQLIAVLRNAPVRQARRTALLRPGQRWWRPRRPIACSRPGWPPYRTSQTNIEQASSIIRRTSNIEHETTVIGTSNNEYRTSHNVSIEHHTSNMTASNIEYRTIRASNIKHRRSGIEHRTSNNMSTEHRPSYQTSNNVSTEHQTSSVNLRTTNIEQ